MEKTIRKGFLRTEDGVSIAFEHDVRGTRHLVVICPGFFNSMKNRWMSAFRDILGQEYDALIFDFRGHGLSKGSFTWLARERFDLEAVLRYAKQLSYSSIGILGFSLGAATAVNTASHRADIASMVLVSAPTGFWDINFHFWEPEMFFDLKDNFECGWEGKGFRAGNMFLRKARPISRIKHIKETPIMFIHGTKDWIIKDYHSRALYEAYDVSTEKKRLVMIKGGLHAERLVQQDREEMERLIMGWFRKTLEV